MRDRLQWCSVALVIMLSAACASGPALRPIEPPWTNIGFVWPADDLGLAFCSVGVTSDASSGQLSVHTSLSLDEVNAFYERRGAEPATVDDALAMGTAASSEGAWRTAERVSAWSLGNSRAVLVGPTDDGSTVINARFSGQSPDVKCGLE